MSNLLTLWWWGLQKTKGWFKVETVAKVLLVVIFIGISVGLALGIYLFSFGLFSFLISNEQFGYLTAEYIWAMLLLVVLGLGILTSGFSAYIGYFNLKKLQSYLPLPLTLHEIFWFKSIQNLLSSLWPLLLFLFPVWAAYARAIEISIFSPSFILATLLLVGLAHGFGNLIAFVVSLVFSSLGKNNATVLLVLLLIVSVFLTVKTLLPLSLKQIYDAPDLESFRVLLYSQPIMSEVIPTNWIRQLITQQQFEIRNVSVLCIVLALYALIRWLVRNSYWDILQRNLITETKRVKKTTFPYTFSASMSIVFNDLLAVVYTHGERNYFLFISFILSVLLMVSFQLPLEKAQAQGWLSGAISVFWFSFFSLIILYANKFVFPLFTKEIRSPHLLFMAPLSLRQIAAFKFLSSILLVVLPTIVGIGVLMSNRFFLSYWSVWLLSVVSLTVLIITVQFVSGMFIDKHGDELRDQSSSTNLSGLLSTAICFGLVFHELFRLIRYPNVVNLHGAFSVFYLASAILLLIFSMRIMQSQLLK